MRIIYNMHEKCRRFNLKLCSYPGSLSFISPSGLGVCFLYHSFLNGTRNTAGSTVVTLVRSSFFVVTLVCLYHTQFASGPYCACSCLRIPPGSSCITALSLQSGGLHLTPYTTWKRTLGLNMNTSFFCARLSKQRLFLQVSFINSLRMRGLCRLSGLRFPFRQVRTFHQTTQPHAKA